jgi:hypothetical protein
MSNKLPGRVVTLAGGKVKLNLKLPSFRPGHGTVIPGTRVKIGRDPVSPHIRKVTGQHG